MIAIAIPIYITSPILSIQLYSGDSCECNCAIFLKIFHIWYSYALQELVFKGFPQNPKSNFILKRTYFSSHLVLGIHVVNYVCPGNLRQKWFIRSMYKKKGYRELLISIYTLCVHLFLHTRECDFSTQVGGEHVMYFCCNYRNSGKFYYRTANKNIREWTT